VVAQICIILIVLWFSISAAATASPLLQGRIEEIRDNPGIKLPPELQATALRLQQTPVGPNILRAELKSFPAILRGEWKGQLKITSADYSSNYISAQPADAAKDQQAVYAGAPVEALFRFYNPRAGLLTMAPPELKIARVARAKRPADYIYLAVNDLDSDRYVSLGGTNKIKNTLLKNDIRMLAPNVVEQDMVVAVLLTDKRSGRQTMTCG